MFVYDKCSRNKTIANLAVLISSSASAATVQHCHWFCHCVCVKVFMCSSYGCILNWTLHNSWKQYLCVLKTQNLYFCQHLCLEFLFICDYNSFSPCYVWDGNNWQQMTTLITVHENWRRTYWLLLWDTAFSCTRCYTIIIQSRKCY